MFLPNLFFVSNSLQNGLSYFVPHVCPSLAFMFLILTTLSPFVLNRYWCQYRPEDYTTKYKLEVQKVFAHVRTQKKNSTNQKKALQRAQKIVDKAAKEVAFKPRPRKKGKATPLPDLNAEAAEDEAEEQKRLEETKDSLRQAQALLDAAVKPKRKTRVGKVQGGMSLKRGCQCNFVAKQLLVDETLCTI